MPFLRCKRWREGGLAGRSVATPPDSMSPGTGLWPAPPPWARLSFRAKVAPALTFEHQDAVEAAGEGVFLAFSPGLQPIFVAAFLQAVPRSWLRPARGGGISTFGDVSKNPNAQIMTSQIMAASGVGHQTRISFDLELGILRKLFVFNRDQKVLRAGRAGTQHRLHNDALRRIVIG